MRTFDLFTVALAGSLVAASPSLAQQTSDQSGQQGTTAQQGTTTEQSTAAAQQGTTTGSQTGTSADAPPGPSGEIRPLTITCRDIVDTDVELVPQLVYWIDGYNIAYDADTGQTDVDPVVTVAENWLAVPANKVITACEASPDRPAAEVIAEEKKKAESGSSN